MNLDNLVSIARQLSSTDNASPVGLTWTDSSTNLAGFNDYRSTVSGGSYVKINSSLVPTSAFTDSTIQSGFTYYYVTTAVDSTGVESAYSNETSATVS